MRDCVQLGDHFTLVAGGGGRHRCNHCAKVIVHKCNVKRHMACCGSLPRYVLEVLHHEALCDSRAGVGVYGGGNAALYRRFRVTGWLAASCRACGVAVPGAADALRRHWERACAANPVPPTPPGVDVDVHFAPMAGGSYTCNHCAKVVVAGKGNCKIHMGRCRLLPRAVREALDREAVRACRAGQGRYAGANHAVYCRFRVTGWLLAVCRACGMEVRGGVGNLKQHLARACVGIKVSWPQVDVARHFTKVAGVQSVRGCHRCNHCNNVVMGGVTGCKQHMAHCRSLPSDVREVLDHATVCESRAGLGRFGGPNRDVYQRFHATGWQVAVCKGCGVEVRGGLGVLRRHLAEACFQDTAPTTPDRPASKAPTGEPEPTPPATARGGGVAKAPRAASGSKRGRAANDVAGGTGVHVSVGAASSAKSARGGKKRARRAAPTGGGSGGGGSGAAGASVGVHIKVECEPVAVRSGGVRPRRTVARTRGSKGGGSVHA